MKSLLTVITNKNLLLASTAWAWFEVKFFPKPMLLFCLAGMMFIDLITGMVRSWREGNTTSVTGFNKTVLKLTRYASVILASWGMAIVLSQVSGFSVDYSMFLNGIIGFLSFIEIYSIFDNVYQSDPNGLLSKYLAGPFLKVLKGKLEKGNPINLLNNKDDEQ